eukprot:3065274-Rhodomonas_salina.1
MMPSSSCLSCKRMRFQRCGGAFIQWGGRRTLSVDKDMLFSREYTRPSISDLSSYSFTEQSPISLSPARASRQQRVVSQATLADANTPRNQMRATIMSVHILPYIRFLEFVFRVYRLCLCGTLRNPLLRPCSLS